MLKNMEKVGINIVVSGTKALLFGAGLLVVYTFTTKGLDGIKDLTLDDVLK
jgi:hypothetical protein